MTERSIASPRPRRRVLARLAHVAAAALTTLAALGGSPAAFAQEPSAAAEPVRQALAAALQALEIEDYAAAEKGFARATDLDGSFAPAWLGLAEARLRLGRAQDALDAARQAQKVAPELGAAAFAVARCLAELGSYGDALGALERVRELEPESPDVLVLSALVLRELDRSDEARALLDGAWARGVRDQRLAEQLAVLRLAAGDAAGAAEVAEQGLAAGESANLELVLAFALAKDPARREEAARRFEQALAAGVSQPGPVRLELGGILLESGRAADALPHLEEAARLLPEVSAAHYKLAQARRATGDEAGAERALARFQELDGREQQTDRDSKELGIALNEAQNLASQNRLDEALARLDALHAAHPDDSRVNAQRAKVLYSMGRRREAEASIAAASARSPGRAEYRYLEGLFHMYAGRLAAAETALRQALEIDGELAEAHALLAGALAKQRKPEEAVVHFQRAIELGADAPEVRLGYAGALETLGRAQEAAAQMDAYRKLTSSPGP